MNYHEPDPNKKAKNPHKVMITVFVVIFVIALALSFIPFLLTRFAFEKEIPHINSEGCTEQIYAVVVRNDATEIYDEASGQRTVYSPVYKYKYNGQSYEAAGSFQTSEIQYQPGTELEIMIDPDAPYHIYDPRSRSVVDHAYLLTLLFPASVLVGSLLTGVFMFLIFKFLKHAQTSQQGGAP